MLYDLEVVMRRLVRVSKLKNGYQQIGKIEIQNAF